MIKNSLQDISGEAKRECGSNDRRRQLTERCHLFCEACDWLAYDGDEPKSFIWWLGLLGLESDVYVAAIKKHAFSVGLGGVKCLSAFADKYDLRIDTSKLQAKLFTIQNNK